MTSCSFFSLCSFSHSATIIWMVLPIHIASTTIYNAVDSHTHITQPSFFPVSESFIQLLISYFHREIPWIFQMKHGRKYTPVVSQWLQPPSTWSSKQETYEVLCTLPPYSHFPVQPKYFFLFFPFQTTVLDYILINFHLDYQTSL